MAGKKTKKNRLTLLFVLVVFVGTTYFFNWYFTRPSFVHYPAFGINMPTSYAIHGIDVSKYQKTIGWRLVKEMEIDGIKVDFVFMKATEGLSSVDNQFSRNWTLAEKHEVTRGAYHFFIAGKSGKAQAENFIKTVRLKKGDLPPVLDVEQTFGVKKDVLQKQVAEWIAVVEKKYGVRPIIYTNASFYETLLAGKFEAYPLWVAHYLQKDRPRINRSWKFWQHSETGRVNGIDAFVDFNVFNGNSIDFENLLVK
ncbi:MAG: glycoside hydrolase family 25 protein [Rhizobacter sp.]|nr:glycoside hydrolase family 25 protein [Ferruginibacter sp.]